MEKLPDAKSTTRHINLQRNAVNINTKAFMIGSSVTAFRKAQIEHGRTEQVILEMDKLAKEDHSYRASKAEIDVYRGNWWLHSNVARVDSIPVRHEPGFKDALSTMQRLKRAEDKKKQEATAQPSSSSSSWHWHSSWWESDYEYSPQKWYDH